MPEARALIQAFIGKSVAAAEETAEASATPIEAAAPPAEAGQNVDTSKVEKEAEDTKKQTKKRPALTVIQGGAKGIAESVPSVSELPTPGGVGLMLLIILFILFAVSQSSSGYSRLQVLWMTILGKTEWGNVDATTSGSTAQTDTTQAQTGTSGPGDVMATNHNWASPF